MSSSERPDEDLPRPYGDPDTRRAILDAAWELLEERGGSVTLADVAVAAGTSRQAVYLHFGDRAGLLVALVDHIDQSFGSTKLRERVFGAPTGVEALRRWIETMSSYTAKIDAVSEILEHGQYRDEALAAAWRNRMGRRRTDIIGTILGRIRDEGHLAPGWTLDRAADLIYVLTMPGPWRELTRELGWSHRQYATHVNELVRRSFLCN